MSSNRAQSVIRFRPETMKKLVHIAKENNRSFNGQMEYLALQCIREYEKQYGPIDIDDSKGDAP